MQVARDDFFEGLPFVRGRKYGKIIIKRQNYTQFGPERMNRNLILIFNSINVMELWKEERKFFETERYEQKFNTMKVEEIIQIKSCKN